MDLWVVTMRKQNKMPTMTTIQLLTQDAGNTDPLTNNTYGLPFNNGAGMAIGTINDYANFAYAVRVSMNIYKYEDINGVKVDGRKMKKFKRDDFKELLEGRGLCMGHRGTIPLPIKKKKLRLIIRKKQ